jgi:uncharacterized protein
MSLNVDRFGPWAVVTGASSGIGHEFARQLAAAGINVVLIARRLGALHEIGDALAAEYGIEYRAVGVDLSDPGLLAPIVDATADLDVGLLVSNAGEASPGAFLDSDLDAEESIVRLNTTAHLDLTHHFAQRLARRGRGGIVLVSALGAMYGIPYNANTGATKAYVASLGEALHVELGKHGVHVTVLLPGPTRTSDLAELGIEAGKLPIPIMPVERCVSETLQALARNRSHCTPGRINRMTIALAPPRLTRTMMAALMSRHDQTRTHAQ